jgi:hypothetical protein
MFVLLVRDRLNSATVNVALPMRWDLIVNALLLVNLRVVSVSNWLATRRARFRLLVINCSQFKNAFEVNDFSDEGVSVAEIVYMVVPEVEEEGSLGLLLDYNWKNLCRIQLGGCVVIDLAEESAQTVDWAAVCRDLFLQ